MASVSVKFSMLVACVSVMVVVAAAQYGDGGGYNYDSDMPNNMPGMAMGPGAPPPSASPRSLSYPAAIIIFLPFLLTLLAAKQRI